MNISRKLKNNRWLRSFFCLWRRNTGNLKRRKFGYIADNVIITPPPVRGCKECVYL